MNPDAPEVLDDPLIARLLQQTSAVDMDAVRKLYDRDDLDDPSLDAMLVESGLVNEREIAHAYSNYYLLQLFDPPDESFESIDRSVADCLPADFCRQYRIVPLSDDGTTLDVAIDCPDSLRMADEVRAQCGRQMRPLFATARIVGALMNHLYGEPVIASEELVEFEEMTATPAWLPSGIDIGSETVVQLDDLLHRALQMRANDIHLEKSSDGCRIRFRIDGTLVEIPVASESGFSKKLEAVRLVAKIGDADFGRGEILWREAGFDLSIEVRCCRVVGGENILLHLQRDPTTPPRIESLSMSPSALCDLKRGIEKPHGLILVSGPTGSGKAETLYSCLRAINDRRLNVFAIEESIRWHLPGVHQIVADRQSNINYFRGIELCLEQDSDVLMVGQIRDSQTAELCVRAASGGRMVFSTIAASRPVSILRHLESFGIAPYAIGETVRALVAQRRVRRLCDACKRPHEMNSETQSKLGLKDDVDVFQASGCDRCYGTGYRGLETVYEVVRVTSAMAEMIREGRPMELVQAEFKRAGGVSLKSAVMKVATDGRTSLAEVRRVL